MTNTSVCTENKAQTNNIHEPNKEYASLKQVLSTLIQVCHMFL